MEYQGKYILMLEPDDDDRWLVMQTLKELNINLTIRFVNDSDQLMIALNNESKPFLLLLNFKSAPDDIFTVIRKVKANEAWASIPVIIGGEQTHHHLVEECYRLGASSFIVKPSSNEAIKQKIAGAIRYWTDVAEV